jgi:hypothetical protein
VKISTDSPEYYSIFNYVKSRLLLDEHHRQSVARECYAVYVSTYQNGGNLSNIHQKYDKIIQIAIIKHGKKS